MHARLNMPEMRPAAIPVTPRVKFRPYWPWVSVEACRPDNLPRLCAALRFGRPCGVSRRGDIAWWQPLYFRLTEPRFSADQSVIADVRAAWRARETERLGELNRRARDSSVLLIQDKPKGDRLILIDYGLGIGEWRTADNANRGEDIIALAMWRWGCDFVTAAARLARVLNINIPRIEW